jgi:hypothetical protein
MRAVRAMAMALPEAAEADHHGMPSFRVRGRIFATVPDAGHVRVMVEEPDVHAACAEAPDACAPLYWGKRLSGVVVDVACVPTPLLRELLAEAWRRRAPRSLAARLDASSPS